METNKISRARMEEIVEVFCDASRRLALTEKELAMAPTVEEVLDAMFGEDVA